MMLMFIRSRPAIGTTLKSIFLCATKQAVTDAPQSDTRIEEYALPGAGTATGMNTPIVTHHLMKIRDREREKRGARLACQGEADFTDERERR
jgi:hypothetical protein